MEMLFLGLGLVLIVEGLVFALAPLRLEDWVEMIRSLTRDQRRLVGLVALAIGVGLVWLSRLM